jgi:hypothetical protein
MYAMRKKVEFVTSNKLLEDGIKRKQIKTSGIPNINKLVNPTSVVPVGHVQAIY